MKLKRLVTVILAISMIFGMFSAITLNSVSAAVGDTEIGVVDRSVIFETDYNSARKFKHDTLTADPRNANLQDFTRDSKSIDSTPFTSEHGGVVVYSHNGYGLGVVPLGYDYSWMNNKDEVIAHLNDELIVAKGGATYEIEFDYWVSGTSNNAMTIGVAQGDIFALSSATQANFASSVVKRENAVTLAAGTYTGEWNRATVQITTDANATAKHLMIYLMNGTNAVAFIDNVKVTTLPEIQTTTVIAENDYSTSRIFSSSMPNCFTAFNNDVQPVEENGNKHIKMAKNAADNHYLYVGAKYLYGDSLQAQYAQNEADAFKVEAGKTYNITFDYRITGSAISTDVNHEFGICTVAGPTSASVTAANKKIIFDETTAQLTGDEWVTYSVVYTVPEDADLSSGAYLAIYSQFLEWNMTYHIDNVKVTVPTSSEILLTNDTVVFENDYTSARKFAHTSLTADPRNAHLQDFTRDSKSIDSTPFTSEHGGVVVYSHNGYGLGVVPLGYDYSWANNKDEVIEHLNTELITAKAGSTYEIQFDYWVSGTSKNAMTIGVAQGDVFALSAATQVNFATSVTKCQQAVSIPAGTYSDEWNTATVKFTVVDSESAKHLMIYLMNGTGATAFIDNVKVTQKAGIAVVTTIDNGKATTQYISKGDITHADFTADGKSVMWYTDANCTVPFAISDYDNNGEFEYFKLYGVTESSETALTKGDLNKDGLCDANDLVEMIQRIINEETSDKNFRTDCNGDGAINLLDLVSMKKYIAGSKVNLFNIGETNLIENVDNYQIVYPLGCDYAKVLSRVTALSELTGVEAVVAGNETADNLIYIGNDYGLTGNDYIIRAFDNTLYVNGGSDDALAAAIDTLVSLIRTGASVNEEFFVDFTYSGEEYAGYNGISLLYGYDFDEKTITAGDYGYSNQTTYEGLNQIITTIDNYAYTRSNIEVENGELKLSAYRAENITIGGTEYQNLPTGGQLKGPTINKGYVEIVAKIPALTEGVCPAVWLSSYKAGSDNFYEIDIFEYFGKQVATEGNNVVKATAIMGDSIVDPMDLVEYLNGNNSSTMPGYADDGEFHKYAVELTETYITWIYDDIPVMRLTLDETIKYDQDMSLYIAVQPRDVAGLTGNMAEDNNTRTEYLIIDSLKVYSY